MVVSIMRTLSLICLCSAQVDLYEVLDSRVKPWRSNLISSRLVPLYTQGWEVFNVTQMVSHFTILHKIIKILFRYKFDFQWQVLKWISNSEENNGILMVTFPSGNWMQTAAVPSSTSAEMIDTHAYLVIFSDESSGKASNKSYLSMIS